MILTSHVAEFGVQGWSCLVAVAVKAVVVVVVVVVSVGDGTAIGQKTLVVVPGSGYSGIR